MQTLTRRGVGDAAAGLGLHFLHMSKGPFSHEAGHMILIKNGLKHFVKVFSGERSRAIMALIVCHQYAKRVV